MMQTLYQCPPSYQCRCAEGTLVTFRTVRVHKRVAEERLRRLTGDQALTLALPAPFALPPSSISQASSSDLMSSSDSDSQLSEHFESSDAIMDDNSSFESSSRNLESHVPQRNTINPFSSPSPSFDLSSPPSTPPLLDPTNAFKKNQYFDETFQIVQECRNFLNRFGWLCSFFLRRNITYVAMDDLLCEKFDLGIRNWKTVVAKAVNLSGLELDTHYCCSALHELLEHTDDATIPPCSRGNCSVKGMLQISSIRLWSRTVALLQSTEHGPVITKYVKESYLQERKDEVLGRQPYKQDFFSGTGFQNFAQTMDQFNDCLEERIVHIFLFLSTDGAAAFRSSTKSFWPVLLYIGNVPPSQRYKFQFILSVFCLPGNQSNLESFLEPLYQELEELQRGKTTTLWNRKSVLVKCHLMHEMAGLPAKKKLLLIKGVNGYSPCIYCKTRERRAYSNSTIYYPHDNPGDAGYHKEATNENSNWSWSPESLPLRTMESINETLDKRALLSNGKEERCGKTTEGFRTHCKISTRSPF